MSDITPPVLVAPDPPADASDGSENVNAVPCTIHTLDGYAFTVIDIGAWAYHEHGIFATGYVDGAGEERDLLIPYDRIKFTELHYDRLIEFEAEQAA